MMGIRLRTHRGSQGLPSPGGRGAAVSYGYDEQLIEAVAVRRRRIESAFMFGDQRLRRAWSDRTRTFVLAAFLAVLAAAGCVAVSFVTQLLSHDTTIRPTTSSISSISSISRSP